jgi:hypothetical protein
VSAPTIESLQERIAFLEREAAGYQRIAKEAAESTHRYVILIDYDGQGEVRFFGPTPEAERTMSEAVARWFKVLRVTSDCLVIKDARTALAAISAKLDEIQKVLTK